MGVEVIWERKLNRGMPAANPNVKQPGGVAKDIRVGQSRGMWQKKVSRHGTGTRSYFRHDMRGGSTIFCWQAKGAATTLMSKMIAKRECGGWRDSWIDDATILPARVELKGGQSQGVEDRRTKQDIPHRGKGVVGYGQNNYPITFFEVIILPPFAGKNDLRP